MVTDEERDYLREAYAADPQMRINGGIRRRLAPLLENDRRRIELLNSLLFSLPGSPVVYYGDEIGMGDNIYLGDRNGVRTPMQWTPDRNGGFSTADPARLFAPPLMDAVYGYQVVNVEAQKRSPASLLHWMRRLVALRRRHRTFGRGTIRFLAPANRKVLAYVREHDGESILCVANLSRTAQPVELDLRPFAGRLPVEMLGGAEFPRVGDLPYVVTLGPYASYWFLLREAAELPVLARPVPRSAPKPPDALDLRPLLLGLDWNSAFDTATHEILERDYLPVHLATRRWFTAGRRRLQHVRIRDHIRVGDGSEPSFVTLLDVTFDEGTIETYLLPVGFLAGEAAERLLAESPELVIARVSGARRGVLHERLDFGVAARLLALARDRVEIAGHSGRLVGTRIGAGEALDEPPAATPAAVTRLNVDQRNTSFVFGERAILKLFRHVEPGEHPEVAAGRHLTSRVRVDAVPPLAGTIEYVAHDGARTALAVAHAFVPHQVTAWDQALDELGRFFDALPAADPPAPGSPAARDRIGWYVNAVEHAGRRTAELHRALATPAGDDAFAPATLTRADLGALADRTAALAAELPDRLAALGDASPPLRGAAEPVRDRLGSLDRTLAALTAAVPASTPAIRVHGDYHLGQLLVTDGRVVVVDFEGDVTRPLAERRRRRPPVDDVAGMLRSYSQAAYSAMATWSDRHPDRAARLPAWARAWEATVHGLFLRAYRAAADPAWAPATEAGEALLRLHLIARAIEDLREELDARPMLAQAPLVALAVLLEE
jgi:maltose alpha-D-glucosyltransferase/alpha-amylase